MFLEERTEQADEDRKSPALQIWGYCMTPNINLFHVKNYKYVLLAKTSWGEIISSLEFYVQSIH